MSYELHAVVIHKPIKLEEAKKVAKDIINNPSKKYYRETSESYRFRNIPKTKFKIGTFRSKIVNPDVTLIFGELK